MSDRQPNLAELDWARLGRYVRERRDELGLSRSDVSRVIGFSEKAIQDVENGREPASRYPRSLPRIVHALGWAAGSDMDILRGGEPTEREGVVTDLSEPDTDLVFILRHLPDADPDVKRKLRRIIESDLDR